MRTLTIAATAAMILSGCGVDGPPVVPVAQPKPGITVSGEARTGVIFTP